MTAERLATPIEPAQPEIELASPIVEPAAEPVLQPEVQAALENLTKHDVLDAYRHRLRGFSLAATRLTTMAGLPAAGITFVNRSFGLGIQSGIGASAALLTGGAISGIAYAAHRRREGLRAEQAAHQQQIIRQDMDGEPVDVVRSRNPKIWKTAERPALRWYGADTEFMPAEEQPLSQRFAKVVTAADSYRLPKVAVSRRLIETAVPAEAGDNQKLPNLADFDQYAVSAKDYIAEAKGVKITDTVADDTLLVLPIEAAKRLAEQLSGCSETPQSDVLAQWLISSKPDHPFRQAYDDWVRFGRPVELTRRMQTILQSSLERHFDATVTPNPIRIMYQDVDRPITDEDDAPYASISPLRLKPHQQIRVNHRGITSTTSVSMTTDVNETNYDYASFGQLAGEDMDSLVARLVKTRTSELAKKADTAINAPELWKLELALYHTILQAQPNSSVGKAATPKLENTDGQTLYDRVLTEKPRTFPRLWLASTGKAVEGGNSLEYRRQKRGIIQKIGAVAAAAAIGVGVGTAFGNAHEDAGRYEHYCSDSLTLNYADDSAVFEGIGKDAFCASIDFPGIEAVDTIGDAVNTANSEIENAVIMQAYSMGLLDPAWTAHIAEQLNQDWVLQRTNDISGRVNLYGGQESQVGDVDRENTENPTLWDLQPRNGASTEGYWLTHVQDHLSFDETYFGGALPPLSNGQITFDLPPTFDSLAPIGANIPFDAENNVRYMRELRVPTEPQADNRPLIGVRGRQLPYAGEIVHFGPNYDYTDERWYSFALPVLKDGDIIAANVIPKYLSNDAYAFNAALQYLVYQKVDGSFHMAVNGTSEGTYLDFSYWVDPVATTELPALAQEPMTVQQPYETSRPLSEVISQEDVSDVLRELGLSTDATLDEVLHAVRTTRNYSYTPYRQQLAHEPLVISQATVPTERLLADSAEYAARLDAANCNVASFLAIVASRGGTDGVFANQAVGLRNNGDNALAQDESHAWTVLSQADADGNTYRDATPSNGPPTGDRPEQAYSESVNQANSIGDKAVEAGKALAVLALTYGVLKAYPATASAFRRRRARAALTTAIHTLAESELNGTLNTDLNLLNHILYAGDEAFDEAIASDHPVITYNSQADLGQRLANIQDLKPEYLAALIESKQQTGQLSISQTTVQRLVSLVGHAQTLQLLY